jgi:hypothetical protein
MPPPPQAVSGKTHNESKDHYDHKEQKSESFHPKKDKDVRIVKEGDSFYAVGDGDKTFKVDEAALKILEMCDGKRSVEGIVEKVSKVIKEDRKDVRPIVERIVSEFVSMKLVK